MRWDTKAFFFQTLVLSVIVQVVTGIIEVGSLLVKVSSANAVLRDLLWMEVIVQVIEGMFYVWLLVQFQAVSNVTPKRYIDWCITTPTMLITLMVYLQFLAAQERGEDTSEFRLWQVLQDQAWPLLQIVSLNWLMLLFGYLGEAGILPTVVGVLLGFVPFLWYYWQIYTQYAASTQHGQPLFWYFFFFWSLYGVVALLPYNLKNACYNVLDLFAKNFFGLFLSYLIVFGSGT